MRSVMIDEDCKILQDDLNNRQRWSEKWVVEFNTNKCEMMGIGTEASRPKDQYTTKGTYPQ